MKRFVGFVMLIVILVLSVCNMALAQSAPPATPGDYKAGVTTPDITNPTKPGNIRMPDLELNFGAGYYNSSNGAHGVSAEGNLVWTHFVGGNLDGDFGPALVGLKLSPGVRATAAFDFMDKNLNNIEVLVPLGSLLGFRSMIDGPTDDVAVTTVFDLSLASNGFAYRRDTDLEQTDLGYDGRVFEFYFHTAREKFDLFGGFYAARFVVGKHSNIGEEYICIFYPFATDFGFGIKAGSFADIRLAGSVSFVDGSYFSFDPEVQESVDKFENGKKPDSEYGYLSRFKTSGTGGFYNLFGSPVSLYYKYAWEMAADADLRPGTMDEKDTTERSIHRHIALLSWAY